MENFDFSSVTTIAPFALSVDIEPNERSIRRAMETLEKQGLIEPLVCDDVGRVGSLNWYDPAYLRAAQRLGWPTVIVVNQRYAQ